jgi:hypothetical protein
VVIDVFSSWGFGKDYVVGVTKTEPLRELVWEPRKTQTMKGKRYTTEQKIRILRDELTRTALIREAISPLRLKDNLLSGIA